MPWRQSALRYMPHSHPRPQCHRRRCALSRPRSSSHLVENEHVRRHAPLCYPKQRARTVCGAERFIAAGFQQRRNTLSRRLLILDIEVRSLDCRQFAWQSKSLRMHPIVRFEELAREGNQLVITGVIYGLYRRNPL